MKTISISELRKKLGGFESVKNAPSRNGENTAPNQFIISFENGRVFQSYSSLVAAKIDGQLYLGEDHDYSVTTSRFLKEWTGMTAKERRDGLAKGWYIKIEE